MTKSGTFIQYLLKPFKSKKDRSDDLEKIAAQEQKQFPFETLVSATKNFHPNHKLGEGGFGPVFKGKLEDGREIAVKKLSQSSRQGKKEFTNEAKLLVRVQHRNVVNLLGYCAHGAEKLLVYEYLANESLDKLLFTDNINQGFAIITPQVHVEDIKRVLDFNGEGTYLVGRARAAQVLLSYRASYGGFIDRRIRAADNPVAPGPPTAPVVEEGHSETPPFPGSPIRLADDDSASSGYSLSSSSPTMNRPIDLSSLLSLPGAGRGRGRGTGRGQPRSTRSGQGRRAAPQTSHPPGFSPEELETGQREKRPRLEEVSPERPSVQASSSSIPLWAPQFRYGNKSVTVRDSADSEGTAMALSAAYLLPMDMQKEMNLPANKLLGSFLVHNAKAMQKMVAMSQKLGQSEPQRAKLAGENAQLQLSIARLERERDLARRVAEEMKTKLENAEDSLHQTITELEASKEESKASYQKGYNDGINVATDSYRDQMPGIQDQVFSAGWISCLKKYGTDESSPLWSEIDLPSLATDQDGEGIEEEEDNVDEDQNVDVPEQLQVGADLSEEVAIPAQEETGIGPTDGGAAPDSIVEEVPSSVPVVVVDTPPAAEQAANLDVQV